MEKYFFPLDENAGEIEVGVYLEKNLQIVNFRVKLAATSNSSDFSIILNNHFFPNQLISDKVF